MKEHLIVQVGSGLASFKSLKKSNHSFSDSV